MTDLVYLHGFSSGPGGNKGRFARLWAEARGIPCHAPDLNLPTFETLTLSAQVAAVEGLLQTLAAPPVLVGRFRSGAWQGMPRASAHWRAKRPLLPPGPEEKPCR